MSSRELTLKDIEALGIPEKIKNQETLRTLAEIACYLRLSISATRRLIKNCGLPATPIGQGVWFTTKALIDKWVLEGHLSEYERRAWDSRPNHIASV